MNPEVVYYGACESTVKGALAHLASVRTGLEPFAPEIIAFCDQLSAEIGRSQAAREHPELQAFAFSIRRAEVLRLQSRFREAPDRSVVFRPRGCVAHFAPANVD